MSRHLLTESDILVVNRTLAKSLGLNASIVLRQIYYWVEHNRKTQSDKHFHDQCWWTFNTYTQWQENNFDFWSFDTVYRSITRLEELGLIFAGNYNERPGDQTKWYTFNFGAYDAFMKLWADHAYPRAGEGRPSAAYKALLEDWNQQKELHTNLASCVDHFSNLRRATPQVAISVTRDYPEDTAEVGAGAPLASDPLDDPNFPNHLTPAAMRGMGMGALIAPNIQKVAQAKLAQQVEDHSVWQAYKRGWDGITPPLYPQKADIDLNACIALQARIEKGEFTVEDIESCTREQLTKQRQGDYLLAYVATDISTYMVRKRSALKLLPDDGIPVDWAVDEFVRKPEKDAA